MDRVTGLLAKKKNFRVRAKTDTFTDIGDRHGDLSDPAPSSLFLSIRFATAAEIPTRNLRATASENPTASVGAAAVIKTRNATPALFFNGFSNPPPSPPAVAFFFFFSYNILYVRTRQQQKNKKKLNIVVLFLRPIGRRSPHYNIIRTS